MALFGGNMLRELREEREKEFEYDVLSDYKKNKILEAKNSVLRGELSRELQKTPNNAKIRAICYWIKDLDSDKLDEIILDNLIKIK